MDLLKETVLLKTRSTLFNLLIRETSQFLCYERELNMTYVAYKNAFFLEMQFRSNCYTVVSYQSLFRLSVYKILAVYLSGAKNVCFCMIRDFGSPTKRSEICLNCRLHTYKQCKHSKGDVDVIMSKFNNPKNIKCAQNKGCTHVQGVSNHNVFKFEYEGMKTARVTDYTNQTPP